MRWTLVRLLILCVCLQVQQASAQSIDEQPQKLFYAGAYFDVPPQGGNDATNYLIAPLVRKSGVFAGDELSSFVEDFLRGNADLNKAVAIAYGRDAAIGKNGNALAIYIPRAQHDVVRFSVPGAPDEYLTIVSISVALDVFTDKAAEKNQLQLESLYSRLLVGEQAVKTTVPLDANGLAAAYTSLFTQTLGDLFNDAAADLGWKRERANAAFQLKDFILPAPDNLAPEVAQLIDSSSEVERTKLSLEFVHLVNKAVSDELRAKGYRDIALLSPPTAWAQSNVGELLANRLVGGSRLGHAPIRFYVDPTLEQGGDLRVGGSMGVLGYTVRTALARADTKVLAESKLQRASRFGVQLLARIYRPQPGKPPKWVPATLPEEARTAKSVGGADFEDVAGMTRGTTRDVAMAAMRSAAKDLAPHLADLMRNIADNRLDNR